MAITYTHHFFLSMALKNTLIQPEEVNSICEIGQQNWYYNKNDQADNVFHSIIKEIVPNEVKQKKWEEEYDNLGGPTWHWDVARLYYKLLFGSYEYTALDMHGTDEATYVDLNFKYDTEKTYQFVTNLGTTEHIFNQAQVFETIHKLVSKNGFVFHSLPHQGQYDHGFFNYHPTFFFDLAAANNYQIILFAIVMITEREGREHHEVIALENEDTYRHLVEQGRVSPQAAFQVLIKKVGLADFVMPQQGVYGDSPDEKKTAFWYKHSRLLGDGKI